MLRAPIQQGPHYAGLRQANAETCRTELGDERFEAARGRGEGLSVAEAIALAKSEVLPPVHAAPVTPLTKRELEIAGLVAGGLGNREIAERLVLSKRTVDAHVEHIFAKLGFNSRAQVAVWFSRQQG
jgi:DNA-binding NarL/FixJ family response regulator